MTIPHALPAALNPDDELTALDPVDIAWRIKRLRHDRGWRQIDLADATDYDRVTVAGWESGRWMPHVLAFVRLADAFGCSLDYLVRGRG